VLTITSNIKTYLSSEDEATMLKKSDAARGMMKKKLEVYEARSKIRESVYAVKNVTSNPNSGDQ